MATEHPIDSRLRAIHPELRRVTLEDLAEYRGGALNVTLLVMARPVLALDVTLHPSEGGVSLTAPRPMPVILAGTGVSLEGVAEPGAITATTCHHPPNVHGEPRWNPLCLALVWFQDLPDHLREVVRAYQDVLADSFDEFCPTGMQVLLAQLRL